MLTKWILKNFKSVKCETNLELAPLTVFAGANSSGKSTIIQSILLTAQTIQSPVHSKSVVLNGHIVRLGSYSDIMSAQEAESKISIGFNLRPIGSDDSAVNTARLVSESFAYMSRDLADRTKLVECSFSFSNNGPVEERDLLELQPRLLESRIKIHVRDEEASQDTEIKVSRSKKPIDARAIDFNLPIETLPGPERTSLEYEVLEPQNLRPGRRYYRGAGMPKSAKCAGAVLSHFLPLRLTIVYDSVEEDVRKLIEALVNYRDARFHNEEEAKWSEISLEFRERMLNLLSSAIIPQQAEFSPIQIQRSSLALETLRREFSFRNYIGLVQSLPNDLRQILLSKVAEQIPAWKELIRAGRIPNYVIRYAPVPDMPAFAVDYVKSYFGSKLKYLGPLRDEPKPVYPLAGATDSKDVGFKGEHTAAVLDIHKNTLVTYLPTSNFRNKDSQPIEKQVTLIEAVADWLSYMGVVQQVKTIDRGKLGHELKVSTTDTDSGTLHDLTHVGVGVSQVLPILVLSLLAESDSTLIFEQPELHLHPRVQTRLAEFFVSMILLNKQCLVETHSEYLINRLRYLSAISSGRTVTDGVILYFVEKAKGQSAYTPIRINEYGAIPNWPKGFFDENEENSAETLRAALEKRRKISAK